MKLSVITTLYRSSPYLNEFYSKINKALDNITDDFEIILVNDHSPDNSLEIAKEIRKKDKKVVIVDLAKNTGHHRAIMTGLTFTKGDYVFLIDCDLEEDPALLRTFWKELHKTSDIDVVYGIQKNRQGSVFRKYFQGIFYTLFNFFSDVKLPHNVTITRLMKRQYVDELVKYQEYDVVIAGLCVLVGFNQRPVFVEKKYKKSTTYTFSKRLSLFINSVTSFSEKPLIYISYIGFFITLISLIMIIIILLRKFLYGVTIVGWSSMIISIWFLGGLTIFCLGIIGIYLAKVFIQVKGRPYRTIKKIYSSR